MIVSSTNRRTDRTYLLINVVKKQHAMATKLKAIELEKRHCSLRT